MAIFLKADVFPARIDACNGGCTTTGAIVQNLFTRIRVRLDKPFDQRHRFLCGMDGRMLHILGETQDTGRVPQVAIVVGHTMTAVIGGFDTITLGKGRAYLSHPLCHQWMKDR